MEDFLKSIGGEAGGAGARGREENPRINLGYKTYKPMDKVIVVRTNGVRENDWEFAHQRIDTGEIVVTKKLPDGSILKKEILPDVFDRTQKPFLVK